MSDVRLGVKIVVVSVAGSVIFAMLGGMGQLGLRELAARQEGEYRANVRALDLMLSVRSAVGSQQEAVLAHILSDEGLYQDGVAVTITATDRTIDESLGALTLIGLPPAELNGVNSVRFDVALWRKSRDVALEAARGRGDRQAVLYTIARLETVARSIKQSSEELLKRLVSRVAAGAEQSSADSARIARLMFVVGISSVVVVLVLALLLARSISRPLAEVVDVLTRVATGDLSKKVTFRRGDEIGHMGRALNDTLRVLQHSFNVVQHQATHDSLTGLANRALLRARMQAAEERARAAVVLLDLDGFKQINDVFGHPAGDHVLTVTAQRLQRSVRLGDTVTRLGGDEFAVLLDDVDTPEGIRRVVDDLMSAVEQTIEFNGQTLSPRVSIGTALWREGQSAEVVMRTADEALYLVKAVRRGVHPNQWHGRASALAADMPAALAAGQFEVWYQPLIRLHDEKLTGVEALIRWHHPELGMISPAEFVPIAEHTDLIGTLGLWVLDQSCRQVRRWHETLPDSEELYVSVNLSPRQLRHPALVDDIRAILRDSGLEPRHLLLEVTESAVVDQDQAIPKLKTLREHGVRIAIDDFGTGYSSLQYLTRLPIDVVKIDRSLVSEIDGSVEHAVIIEAVVHLGQVLHFTVVAEGVESTGQADELRQLGCTIGQGYLWSPPQPPCVLETHFAALTGAWLR